MTVRPFRELNSILDSDPELAAGVTEMERGRSGLPAVCPTIDFLEAFRRRRRAIATRVSTGIPTLDETTRGGLSGGDVITCTGKPGSGKTTLAIQLAISRARKLGLRAYIYGPDQGWTGIFERLLGDAGIGDSLDALDDEAAEASFAPVAEELARLVALVDETMPGASIETFRKFVHASGDACVAVVDSAQTAIVDEDEGERQRIDAVMDQAKRLADSAMIPVLVVSQSNRASWASKRKEDRTDPMSSGRGSAAIEHRSQVLLQLEKLGDGTFAVVVPKVAMGKAGATFRLALDTTTWRLHEVDAGPDEEAVSSADRLRRDAVDADVLKAVKRAWTGGETPSLASINRAVRADRQLAGIGLPNSEVPDSLARLERKGLLLVDDNGPGKAKTIRKPRSAGAGEDLSEPLRDLSATSPRRGADDATSPTSPTSPYPVGVERLDGEVVAGVERALDEKKSPRRGSGPKSTPLEGALL